MHVWNERCEKKKKRVTSRKRGRIPFLEEEEDGRRKM